MAHKLQLSLSVVAFFFSFSIVAIGQQTPGKLDSSGPTVQHFVAPEYPLAAWLAKVQGNATAEVTIKGDGAVDLVRFVSGSPIFQRSIEVALKRWAFRVPSVSSMKITAEFKLDNDCSWAPSTAAERNSRSRIETQVSADLPSRIEKRTCPPVIKAIVDQSQGR